MNALSHFLLCRYWRMQFPEAEIFRSQNNRKKISRADTVILLATHFKTQKKKRK